MKEYVMILDPFVMDQTIYECIDGQLKIAATFQVTQMETYAPLFELLNQAKDEQIVVNLKCPKLFRDKVKEKIYNYTDKFQFERSNLIIKDI